jgi:hypothetical protein
VAVEVASGDGAAEAEVAETGVAGLVLSRAGRGSPWRLVHEATGLLVSRSAVSHDPKALVRLAHELAPVANWSARELTLPGPALRQAVEKAAGRCGLALGALAATTPRSSSGSEPPWPGGASVQRDLDLLRRVVRLLHGAVPPGVFASAIAGLDAPERARLRVLLLGEEAAGSVVKPITASRAPAPRPPRRPAPAAPPGSAPGPGSATG